MERVAVGLTRGLQGRGWNIRCVFPRFPRDPALLEWCRAQGVEADDDPAVLEVLDAHTLSSMGALRRMVRRYDPDVVNLHYGDNFISLKDVIAVRLSGRRRIVATVHHPTPWDARNSRKKTMTRLASLLSNGVTTVSRATQEVVKQAGVSPRKITLIPSGMPAPACCPTRQEARARLGLPPDAFVVSTLAQLVPRKGIANLIAAAAHVSDREGRLRLLIGGEGPERAALEIQGAHSPLAERVHFLGRVESTDDLYASSDLFVLPSYMEGFGLVYIEAAFHGVPSIGTTVGGVPEAIDDGVTGVLVPPGDIEKLAIAIEAFYADPTMAQRMGTAARARARADFTEARMADCYADVFQAARSRKHQ